MARYKNLGSDTPADRTGVIVNDGTHPTLPQGATIPNAAGNKHWQEFLEWEAEPNTPDSADPAPADPCTKHNGERYTTAGRPTLSATCEGYIIDTDLGKPVYANAGTWIDSTGTAV